MRRFWIVLGLIAILIVYTLSIGPVFAYYSRSYYDHGGRPMPKAMFQVYRPLFVAIPGPIFQYLRIWGVSEIEAFFVSEPSQDWREVEDDAARNE
ncbi:MAG: hypothetical protein ABSG53_14670 [Thermoguttaceae bacterium]